MVHLKVNRFTLRKYLFVFYVLFPLFVIYAVLRFEPILRTIGLSFYQWNLVSASKHFIGFANYVNLYTDQDFITAISNNILYVIFTVPVTAALSLLVASLLNARWMKSLALFQVVYFIPAVTSMVPVGIMWKWVYDPSYGILNYALSLFGIRHVAWLLNSHTQLLAIGVVAIWKWVGYYMIIFFVGLKNIPDEYYQAATVDGATGWQQFWRITLPLLRPITLFVIVIASIQNFQVFTLSYVMTVGSQGNPGNVFHVLVYEIYADAFQFYKFGYASAAAVVLFVFILVLTLIQMSIARER